MTSPTELLQRVTEVLFGRYQVERVLGAGGMATVFLAKELNHNREVAIKVLRTEVSQTAGACAFH
jgi:serine/threonine-protein kinase